MARPPDKQLQCPACSAVLPWQIGTAEEGSNCPSCRKQLEVNLFPALYRESSGTAGTVIQQDGEAACFYHADKRAEYACESCGRFLCALCDVDFAGRHLCPRCIEVGHTKSDKEEQFVTRRTLYDSAALSMATLPVLLFGFPSFVMAPAAIVFSAWYWRRPTSLIPRTRIRFVLAILLASAEIVGWYALIRMMMLD